MRLLPNALELLSPGISGAGDRPVCHSTTSKNALFVCTRNSARSQLAAALWEQQGLGRAESAGTQPAATVHPLAIAAGQRIGLVMKDRAPRHIDEVSINVDVVVTVCDQARENIECPLTWLHWSIPDPATSRSATAFDKVVSELKQRIERVKEAL